MIGWWDLIWNTMPPWDLALNVLFSDSGLQNISEVTKKNIFFLIIPKNWPRTIKFAKNLLFSNFLFQFLFIFFFDFCLSNGTQVYHTDTFPWTHIFYTTHVPFAIHVSFTTHVSHVSQVCHTIHVSDGTHASSRT